MCGFDLHRPVPAALAASGGPATVSAPASSAPCVASAASAVYSAAQTGCLLWKAPEGLRSPPAATQQVMRGLALQTEPNGGSAGEGLAAMGQRKVGGDPLGVVHSVSGLVGWLPLAKEHQFSGCQLVSYVSEHADLFLTFARLRVYILIRVPLGRHAFYSVHPVEPVKWAGPWAVANPRALLARTMAGEEPGTPLPGADRRAGAQCTGTPSGLASARAGAD